MTSLLEKGGGTFPGIKMLLCENPLPPLNEAVAAAQEELGRSNLLYGGLFRTTSPAAE